MNRWFIFAVAVCAGSCTPSSAYEQATCVLVDVSGTYADQKGEVVQIVRNGILPRLDPGDALIVAAIDSRSYEETNILARTKLDRRPSKATAQKLAFAEILKEFANSGMRASHTDIPGAMMLCAEHLKASGAGSKVLIVFSDLREDLPDGATRTLDSNEFAGIHVAAINVKKLRDDNLDPQAYRARLSGWAKRVREHGAADWQVILDNGLLPEYLAAAR